MCCAYLVWAQLTLGTMHHFGNQKSSLAVILIADAFLLIPYLMNPIVYNVKTLQIRVKVLEKFGLKCK
jgi:hypothetical protein